MLLFLGRHFPCYFILGISSRPHPWSDYNDLHVIIIFLELVWIRIEFGTVAQIPAKVHDIDGTGSELLTRDTTRDPTRGR